MRDIAIRAEKVGKQYHIGVLQRKDSFRRYKLLRDSISSAVSAPVRAVRAMIGRSETQESAQDLFWALKDVSFEVKHGEIVGVIGKNGAGKSTLLKILSRITEPTTGRAEIYGRVGSLLEVGTGFHPELTGRDNVYLNGAILGMKRAEIVRQFDEIVAFAGIDRFIDTPVKHYSTGMYLRLAFAIAAHLETEILLVDEVLAVGDQLFQEKCLGKMQDVARSGRTVLFVSHSMSAIERLCQRAIVLENGGLIADSSPQAAIADYIGADLDSTFHEVPSKARASIPNAALRMENQSLVLSVEFLSPVPLTPPVLGFIMYNSQGVPIFGTNTRVDPLSPPPQPSTRGRFEVAIPVCNFRPDRYLFSIFLGDHHDDYCSREKILKIDLRGSVGGGLPVSTNGNAYVQTVWKFDALKEM